MYVDLAHWQPDADPHQPGVLTDVEYMVPTQRSMRAANDLVATEMLIQLADIPAGAHLHQYSSLLNAFIFVATATKMYRADIGVGTQAWIDVTGPAQSGANPMGQSWKFASMGDDLIASSIADAMKVYTGSAFVAVTPSTLKAQALCVSNQFALCGNYQEASTYVGDGWRCSQLGNPLVWTLSVPNQAVAGRLRDTPGPIVGMREFGGNVYAFKDSSIYRGVYQGPPIVWSWGLISANVGAFSQECIVEADNVLYWWGYNGCWMFDGSRPVRVPNAPISWARTEMRAQSGLVWRGTYDAVDRVIRWYFRSNDNLGTSLDTDRCIIYHPETNRWGRDDIRGQATLSVSQFVTNRNPEIRGGVIHDRYVKTYSGSPKVCSFTTGYYGDGDRMTLLRGVRIRYVTAPSTATMQHFYRNNSGIADQVGEARGETNGKFDISHEARWHKVRVALHGGAEMRGLDMDIEATGAR